MAIVSITQKPILVHASYIPVLSTRCSDRNLFQICNIIEVVIQRGPKLPQFLVTKELLDALENRVLRRILARRVISTRRLEPGSMKRTVGMVL